ncbi:ATP-dependent sacrificial sulfur transferase LarE, partial [Chlamydiota bacterium]
MTEERSILKTDDTALYRKYKILQETFLKLKKVLIAYSGGVDSTFLLKVAYDVLQEDVLAVTATSPTYALSELEDSIRFARAIGCRHLITESNELEIPEFSENTVNRCFYCKDALFLHLKKIAHDNKITSVLDGSTFDDLDDYRPGRRALDKHGVISPLCDVGLTKNEIRLLSKELGLETSQKPSYACLSSRIPYGMKITQNILTSIGQLELFLKENGFRQVRARYYNELVRIE